jgi:peptide/nickel transport system permease protein
MWFARRLLHLALVLVALSLVTFLMLQALPGSIVDQMLGDRASAADIKKFEAELGLDRPLPVRYLKWLGHAVHGDLGRSPISGEDVAQAIRQRLPVSLQLMVYAQVLALLIALPLGTWAGYREGSLADRAISGTAFGVLAVPHFVLGILLILVFAIRLPWFPATGHVAFTDDPLGSLRSMVLPSLTLALVEAPVYLRLLRGDIASTMREEFITVARAKGLSDGRILLRHALRPSSLGLITVLGINIGHLIGGAVIIETVFALPGVGRLLIEAIIKRDYVPLQGVVLFIGASFVLINMLVDAAYAAIDPRLS